MTTPSMGDEPRQVRITTHGTTARIKVNGTDVTDLLQGYRLEQHAQQPPLLLLFAQPHKAGVGFDGLAHVAVATEQDPGQIVADFLTGIDPGALENAALNRDDLDDERYGVTRAVLAQLADLARSGRVT